MWNFDDTEKFTLIHHFRIPAIYTWGNRDREKREEIRRIAFEGFPEGPFDYEWYGFRIKVKRNRFKSRIPDLENVPKLIVNAFSGRLIDDDNSEYPEVEIYENDDLRWLRVIHIEGDFAKDNDGTEVWIFGKNR